MAETHEDSPATDELETNTPPRPPSKWKFDEIETVTMETQERVNAIEATTKTTLDIMRVELNEVKSRLNATPDVQPKLDNIERLLNSLMAEVGVRTEGRALSEGAKEKEKLLKDAHVQTWDQDANSEERSILSEYPGPTPAMLAADGVFLGAGCSDYGTNILCSSRGDVILTFSGKTLEEWKNALVSKDECLTRCPPFILPTYLGGGLLRVRMEHAKDSADILFLIYLFNENYNMENVKLPMNLRLSARFYQSGGRILLASAESGKIIINEIGKVYPFFRISKYIFLPDQSVTVHFFFDK